MPKEYEAGKYQSEDDMPQEVFEDYSNKLERGEIEPISAKVEKEEEKKEPEAGKEKTAEEAAEDKPDEKAKSEEGAAKTDDSDDEEDEEGEDKKETDTDNRTSVPSMPLSKYKKQKEKWAANLAATVADIEARHKVEMKELEDKIKAPEATKKSVETDIEKFAEENGIADPNVIKGLVEVISKNLPGLDPETKKTLEDFKASQKSNAEEAAFEADFAKTAIPLLRKLNPDIDEAHLKEAKAKLKELAYDDKYVKLPLDELIELKSKSFSYNLEKKKTVEASRPGSMAADKVVDYDSWTPEDIDKASPEEFEKYSEHMASKSGSSLGKMTDKHGNEVK